MHTVVYIRQAVSAMPDWKQALSILLSVSITVSGIGLDGCKKEQPAASQQAAAQQAPATTYATPSPDQLYQLVAPIALFPDNLVAQVLAGSTYPDQITAAEQWLKQNSSLKGQQLMEAVNQQSWDDSVKGLTQFPDVLGQMASNLSWTSALGDAYFNVPQSVMNAVQVMRQRAQQAGNLKSTPQQNVTVQNQPPGAAPPPETSSGAPEVTVVQPPPQTIIIQPAQPEVVYVPTYNPTVVYGAPVPVYPGYVAPVYSTGAMVATGLISFGVGMAVGAAISGGGCCGWGYNSWGCGWHNSSVTYNHNTYISNSNTFVNRNNYYNRNNVNANINRNNVNANINRNNINNNVNRNNPNNRANNFNNNGRNSNYTTPKFNQKDNASQFQNNRGNQAQNNNNRGNAAQNNNNRGNLAQNNGQRPGGGNQANGNQQNRPGTNQQNRPGAGQNQSRPNQQPQRDASRGYGQQPNRGASNNALGNYSQGGNARTNSARGQQSLQGNRSQPAAGGGNRAQAGAGGGNRGGGGGGSRSQPQGRQGGGGARQR